MIYNICFGAMCVGIDTTHMRLTPGQIDLRFSLTKVTCLSGSDILRYLEIEPQVQAQWTLFAKGDPRTLRLAITQEG